MDDPRSRPPENRNLYRRIFDAAEKSLRDFVDVIEAERISLRITNGAGQSLAHIAAKHDNVEVLRYVLEREPHLLEKKDVYKCTILHLAVVKGSIHSVKYLVEEHDADICYLGGQYRDRTAVHVAIEFNHLSILKYFVEEREVDFNEPNPKQTIPPLFLTVRHRNWDVIEYLIEEKDANVKMLNSNEENILFSIVRENFMGFLKYLLDEKKYNFDVDWRSVYGETLVHIAAIMGRVEMLAYLVDEKFAYVNAQKTTDKRTPLHYAASRDNYEVCQFLIEHGANPLLEDSYGETAAAKTRDKELFEYLRNATKLRRPQRLASPYSPLQPPTPFLQFTPQKSIAHAPRTMGYVGTIESLSPSNHTHGSCFQSFLLLAQSMTRAVRKERELKHAISSPPSASLIQSRFSSIAIDTIDANRSIFGWFESV